MDSNCLPSDSWMKILSFLDYDDLIRCSYVNSQLNEIANLNSNWRRLCKQYWLITQCPENSSWKELFKQYYIEFGRYINYYAKIKTAWDQITTFMEKNCSEIYFSIKEGTTEEDLNRLECEIGYELPNDLRCAYRIHNGQKLSVPGLFGSMSTIDHYRSDNFMDVKSSTDCYLRKFCSLPITICINTGQCIYMALEDNESIEKSQLFYIHETVEVEVFLIAKNFAQWFIDYAWKLSNDKYPIINGQPFRFEYNPECVWSTNAIRVSVATCFLPECSCITLSNFYHAYRITMAMDPDASDSDSCQLETRHWRTVDEDGNTEIVNGPGVVGEYPIMRPGQSFSWTSCTSFSTTYGSMFGYFRMRNLKTGAIVDVMCPPFHMRCLPHLILNKELKE